jgi:hypothetical protein
MIAPRNPKILSTFTDALARKILAIDEILFCSLSYNSKATYETEAGSNRGKFKPLAAGIIIF